MQFKTEIKEEELGIFWFGQNSFFLKMYDGTLISIDPYFSRSPSYNYIHTEPPLKPEQMTADYVFCTHDHLDHTDSETLSIINKNSSKTIFLGPPESHNHFLKIGIPESNAVRLELGVAYEQRDFKVTPYSSILGTELDYEGKPWVSHYGYLFDFGFVKVYNSGDLSKEATDSFKELLKEVSMSSLDIAIFPIVGDIPNRTPEDARKFVQAVEARIAIPSHYDCFSDRTIDPAIYIKLCQESGIDAISIDYKGVYIYRSK